jgi:hypothetical protein
MRQCGDRFCWTLSGLHTLEVFRENGHQSSVGGFRRNEGIISPKAGFEATELCRSEKSSSAVVRGYIYLRRARLLDECLTTVSFGCKAARAVSQPWRYM